MWSVDALEDTGDLFLIEGSSTDVSAQSHSWDWHASKENEVKDWEIDLERHLDVQNGLWSETHSDDETHDEA